MNMHRIGILACLTLTVSCTELSDPLAATGDDGILFLAQATQPNVFMDALFEGVISLDAQGCLRLDAPANYPERHTVIWPFGSTIGVEGSDLVIRHATGEAIATVGGAARFGGGEVADARTARDTGALDPALLDDVLARCPGRFWIVGDTS